MPVNCASSSALPRFPSREGILAPVRAFSRGGRAEFEYNACGAQPDTVHIISISYVQEVV